ncbi:VanZ family protein [Kitasatospora sp. NPDC059571]|uniref:VanZ family protein n=1 Tax=Kitasatospora sp. NPDC059571 TaxID=3346871 RepID=UPI0036AD975F
MHRHGTTTRTGSWTGDAQPAEDGPARALPPTALPLLRTAARLLLVGYLAVLGWLVLRPVSVNWTYPANLTPFASVDRALAIGGYTGVRQIAAGLLPIAPLGVLLPFALGPLRTPWATSFLRTAGGTALLATGFEILESWTPGRVLNVDDILLGTLGAAVCHLAVVPAGRALLRRLAERPAAPPVHRPPAEQRDAVSPSGTSRRPGRARPAAWSPSPASRSR